MTYTYTFSLYRRVKTPRGVVTSSHWVDRDCDCPFRERRKLCEEYPRWAVGIEPKTAIDFDFECLFYFQSPNGKTPIQSLNDAYDALPGEKDDDQN